MRLVRIGVFIRNSADPVLCSDIYTRVECLTECTCTTALCSASAEVEMADQDMTELILMEREQNQARDVVSRALSTQFKLINQNLVL